MLPSVGPLKLYIASVGPFGGNSSVLDLGMMPSYRRSVTALLHWNVWVSHIRAPQTLSLSCTAQDCIQRFRVAVRYIYLYWSQSGVMSGFIGTPLGLEYELESCY